MLSEVTNFFPINDLVYDVVNTNDEMMKKRAVFLKNKQVFFGKDLNLKHCSSSSEKLYVTEWEHGH